LWDEHNVQHLWQSHRVTPDEVEEILLGIEGDEVVYRLPRHGDYVVIYGETGSGRLLKMAGEFRETRFRGFAVTWIVTKGERIAEKSKDGALE
jgi:hypothetical protein